MFISYLYNLCFLKIYGQDVFIKRERKDQIHLDMKNNPENFTAFVRVLDVLEFDKNWSILVLEMGNPLINPDYKAMQDLYLRFFDNINSHNNPLKKLIYEDFKLPNLIVTNDGVIKVTDLCGLQYTKNWKCLCNRGTLFTSWSASEPNTKASLTLAIQTMYFSILMTDNVNKTNAHKWFKGYTNPNLKKNTHSSGFTDELLECCIGKSNPIIPLLKALIDKNDELFQNLFLNMYKENACLINPSSQIRHEDYYSNTKRQKRIYR